MSYSNSPLGTTSGITDQFGNSITSSNPINVAGLGFGSAYFTDASGQVPLTSYYDAGSDDNGIASAGQGIDIQTSLRTAISPCTDCFAETPLPGGQLATLQAGETVTVDVGANQENVTILSLSCPVYTNCGTNDYGFYATFTKSHASGAPVFVYNVNTTLASATTTSTTTATLTSTSTFQPNMLLSVDTGTNQEWVVAQYVNSGSQYGNNYGNQITTTFLKNHAAGVPVVEYSGFSWIDDANYSVYTPLQFTEAQVYPTSDMSSCSSTGPVFGGTINEYAPLLTGITFPDSSAMQFSYEPGSQANTTTGRLAGATLPTGGTISYSYGTFNCTYLVPSTLTRTTSDGTWTFTWTSLGELSSGNYGSETTMVDPGGNKTVYEFTSLAANYMGAGYPSAYNGDPQSPVLTQVTRYLNTGTPSSPSYVEQTQDTFCYNNNRTSCATALTTLPITEKYVEHEVVGSTNWDQTSYAETQYDQYSDVTSSSIYNFGASSPTYTATRTYGSWTGVSNICSPISNLTAGISINDHPCEVRTVDGNGAVVSDSRFVYDGFGDSTKLYEWTGNSWLNPSATWNTPTVHTLTTEPSTSCSSTNTNCVITVSSNAGMAVGESLTVNPGTPGVTTVTIASLSGSTGVGANWGPSVGAGSIVLAYNPATNGTVASTTDASGVNTTYGYGAGLHQCGVSHLPTSTTVGSLTTTAAYDCASNEMATFTDANSQTTTFSQLSSTTGLFDPYFRILQTTDPTGTVYNDIYTPTSHEGVFSFPASSPTSTEDQTTFVDGYGRPIEQQTKQSPSASTYDTETLAYAWSINGTATTTFNTIASEPCGKAWYGTTGEVCSFHNSALVYAPAVQNSVDGFGRIVQIQSPSMTGSTMNTTTVTYAANDALSTSLDSNGNADVETQTQYDGLGRVTSICNIGSSLSGAVSCGENNGSYSGILTTVSYNPVDTPTTLTEAISTTGSHTVTVGTTTGMQDNMPVTVDTGSNQEIVYVTSFTSSSFTATFTKTHASGATVVFATAALQVTATRGVQTHTDTYDMLGRATSSITPESGTTTYYYDSIPSSVSSSGCGGTSTSPGHLLWSAYANGGYDCNATWDADGRPLVSIFYPPTGATGSNNAVCVRRFYDNSTGATGTIPPGISTTNTIGRLEEMETDNCNSPVAPITDEWFSYDVVGRPTTMWEKTPHSGQYYESVAAYFANDDIASMTLESPSFTGAPVYTLDGEGRPYSLKMGSNVGVNSVSYNAAQQPTNIGLGSSTDTDIYSYFYSGQMLSWEMGIPLTQVNAISSMPWCKAKSIREM